MQSLKQALSEVIQQNAFLQAGLYQRLFNLTQLSRYLLPILEVRLQKPLSVNAITMALSRAQSDLPAQPRLDKHYRVNNVSIHSGLATLTYTRTDHTQVALQTVLEQIRNSQGYVSLSQGMRELTLIVDQGFYDAVCDAVVETPRFALQGVAAVGVEFGQRYENTPGLLHSVLQRIAMQNINIIEISSTYSEVVVYVEELDAMRTFDTLYHCFATTSSDANKL